MIPFSLKSAELFVPDGLEPAAALARTTHLGVGAHQDDLEIMAAHGILECYQRQDRWFTGVVVTNGSGSPRAGLYAATTDAQMRLVRRVEQKKAAFVGGYGAQVLFDHASRTVKEAAGAVIDDLAALLEAASPEIVYTHNLADKHDTHVGVTLAVLAAIRRLPFERRPRRLVGCEVWRDLDWMVDDEKVALDVSAHENLQASLVGVFDSQIAGGKRYDLATLARRKANATYFAAHGVDEARGLIFAMDLTPLIRQDDLDPGDFVSAAIDRFARDVAERVERIGAKEA